VSQVLNLSGEINETLGAIRVERSPSNPLVCNSVMHTNVYPAGRCALKRPFYFVLCEDDDVLAYVLLGH